MFSEQNHPKKDSNELAEERTNLAYQRTALANDRTLMAWVRTSTSLTSFGFTIYKFFQEIRKTASIEDLQKSMISSRDLGMILILFGFLGLLFALIQYRTDMKSLRESYSKIKISFTPVLAMLMLLLSFLLLLAAFFRQ
ncbi:MAG: DUF202 domain-containing protein [Bacteroidetes bacterium]|nr:DUF202 domain-containing protein [Bacteroidota bacterium]